MSATSSSMLELGTAAPDFALPDTDGKTVRLSDFEGTPALLVMFLSNHCPYVKHLRPELTAFVRAYQPRGLTAVGVMSNDVARYPDDRPEKMRADAKTYRFTFPYLYDASQDVAKTYRAACTPDFFLFDADRKLMYRGQFDGSRPGNDVPITGEDLRAALDATLAGRRPAEPQMPSLGCNIKWKPGNEPIYFG